MRFIGDAVLAIFPADGPGGREDAVRLAVAAADEAGDRLARVNAARIQDGEPPLAFGLGLHVGTIMFGNIGVPERLEFSVIGPAANEVARLEELTKTMDRPVVASAAFAQYLPSGWQSLGRHGLRGVDGEMEVFSPE